MRVIFIDWFRRFDYPSTQLATPLSVLTDTTIELPDFIAPSLSQAAFAATYIVPIAASPIDTLLLVSFASTVY